MCAFTKHSNIPSVLERKSELPYLRILHQGSLSSIRRRLPVSPRKSVMSRVSSSRAVTRLSVHVLVFSMLILMLSSLLSRGWLFAAGLLPAWQLLLPTCWPSWWWGERTDSVLLVCKLTPVVALPFTSRKLGARRPPPPPPPPPPEPVTERPPPPPPPPPPPSPSLQQFVQLYISVPFLISCCEHKLYSR